MTSSTTIPLPPDLAPATSGSAQDAAANSDSTNRTMCDLTPTTINGRGSKQPWAQFMPLEAGEVEATFTLYHVSSAAHAMYLFLSVVTAGLFALVCYWLPHRWVRMFGRKVNQIDDSAVTAAEIASSGMASGGGVAIVPKSGSMWVGIVNSWGEADIAKVSAETFRGSSANVFGTEPSNDEKQSSSSVLAMLVSFEYRSLRFVWNPAQYRFAILGEWKDGKWTRIGSAGVDSTWALSEGTIAERKQAFGENSVVIAEPSTLHLILFEVISPFTVFQVFSLIIWSVNDYYWYAMAVFLITVISAIMTLRQTKQNIHRLRELGQHASTVRVLREHKWITLPSESLVPGDLVAINHAVTPELPCDVLLLSGDAVADESMLTGESVPVAKTGTANPSLVLRDLDLTQPTFPDRVSRFVLFSGTKLIRVRGGHFGHIPADDQEDATTAKDTALGLVLRTGFNTAKGTLIRSMLHPRPHRSEMTRDAFKFLGVLGLFGLVGMVYTLYMYISEGSSAKVIIIRSLDVFTIIIPPALPACLSAGISFALGRLRPRKIFCISPNHINMAGQVRCVVFDKTGTLTEDGLDVLGVQPRDGEFVTQVDQVGDEMVRAMAVCHDVKVLGSETGSGLIGDPLDVKMLEWTRWTVRDSVQHGMQVSSPAVAGKMQEISVVKVYEFAAALRRMAVIVTGIKDDAGMRMYAKGAPESMAEICDQSTIPANYDALVNDFAHRGLRVLAVATRPIKSAELDAGIDTISRAQMEQGLAFLGFVVFENQLKPGSRVAVETLRDAAIRCLVCTGDNILTAVSVGREARILDPLDRVYVPRVMRSEKGLVWEAHDDATDTLDGGLHALATKTHVTGNAIVLAVTGEAWEYLLEHASPEDMTVVLSHGVVFARMAPEQKRSLVEKLRDHYNGTGVAFVGDGANDVSALRAADVGLSLSEAEASIAAPFTSAERDIGCVLTLIKEGRAALVTTHSCFKFMAAYSCAQFSSVCLLYAISANLGDFQFLYIDLILVFPLALAMARSEASQTLARRPPADRLLSAPIMFVIVAAIMLQLGMQFFIFFYVRMQSWYTDPEVDPENKIVSCLEGTAVFLLSCFMYMCMAVCFAAGEPYRTNLFKNRVFVSCLAVVLGLTITLANIRVEDVMWFFDLKPLQNGFQWQIVGFAAIYAAVVLLLERAAGPLFDQSAKVGVAQ
ncbi:hypothetical protein BCR44DRAFT_1431579 [Catenaria anguillulae PL171]|uniref:Cation-transporting ATPase n=1 Tax=Catenaria anguillulae PL171 TaxID=765915 RepID=A0A1Y2HT97_9FUNG|nr:hypothetical protein BCR44DRAFT_1431579 [Catenaria anguillulae PL171]